MSNFLIKFIKTSVKHIKDGILSVSNALQSGTQEWNIKNHVISYICGICTAIVFWKVFIASLQFSIDFTYGVLIILLIVLGIGFVFTRAIKCITILACVGLLGKTGRSFLRALCMTYIITGPLANLALNAQETVRVFACTTMLTYNLTKTRFDLMTKPFQNTLAAMKDEMADVSKNFEDIKEVIDPIKEEIEGDFQEKQSESNQTKINEMVGPYIRQSNNIESPEYIQTKYLKKMQLRCEEQMKKGENRCKSAFAEAHSKCKDKLPMVLDKLLCWPLKVDYVCNMKLMGGGICDPSEVLDPSFGENFVELKETSDDLLKNVTSADISLKIVKVVSPDQLKSAQETANGVMNEVKAKKKAFDYVLSILQTVLSFVFLKVIHSSIMYHRKFLRKIDFDNIYITPYFKKIDERRREANQHTLLPLKKFEKELLVDTDDRWKRTRAESRTMTFLLVQFFLELLVSVFFLLLDHMVVILLRIVAAKAEITYYQEGEHRISVHVNGTGLMAKLMRKTLTNFNMHERVSTYLTNIPCLPKPSSLTMKYYLSLIGIYFLTLLLIYYSPITLRSRKYICSFFYRKREKQRVLYLYNKMLKNRKMLFDTMYSKVKDDIELQKLNMHLNIFLWLRLKFPTCCGWLRWFSIARRKCLVCGELKPRRDDGTAFVECENKKCYFIYCKNCWLDIGESCMACGSEENIIRLCETTDDEL